MTVTNEQLGRLVDAHVHPHDTDNFANEFDEVSKVACGKVCVMSSHVDNQSLTTDLFKAFPEKVIPAFGIHPWFCHRLALTDGEIDKTEHYQNLFKSNDIQELIEYLPEPVPLEEFLETLRSNLNSTPKSMLGEVGLDKAFRIPDFAKRNGGTKNNNNNSMNNDDNSEKVTTTTLSSSSSSLTKLKTPMDHQLKVLEAQVEVAVQLGKPCSFHCVQSQGQIVDLLTKCSKKYNEQLWTNCHVCLHSFLGSVDTLKRIQKEHKNVYFSFSSILGARSERTRDLILTCRSDRILVETDYHSATQIDSMLKDIVQQIAHVKDWTLLETVDILETNWNSFYKQ